MLLVGTAGPSRPSRHGRRAVVAAISALVLLVAVGVVVGVRLVGGVFGGPADYPGPGTGRVVVAVAPGASATAIARTLVADGVVRSVGAFVAAADANPRSRDVQPGYYALRHQMKASLALGLLLDPASNADPKITLREGLRLSEALAQLAAGSKIPLAQFTAALAHPQALGLPAYARGHPEGFLYPNTYLVVPGTTAADLLQAAFSQFTTVAAAQDLPAAAAARGITPYQAVIVASLVQAEASRPQDMPKVARVIDNRLAAGMKLQLDTTVNYALGQHTLSVTAGDLGVNSPYNTYRVTGLPPGPIDSPGQTALAAALHPAPGDWLYFVTTNPVTGQTKFTASYPQFLAYKAQFEASLR